MQVFFPGGYLQMFQQLVLYPPPKTSFAITGRSTPRTQNKPQGQRDFKVSSPSKTMGFLPLEGSFGTAGFFSPSSEQFSGPAGATGSPCLVPSAALHTPEAGGGLKSLTVPSCCKSTLAAEARSCTSGKCLPAGRECVPGNE